MKKVITILVSFLLIVMSGFYIYSQDLFDKKIDNNKQVSNKLIKTENEKKYQDSNLEDKEIEYEDPFSTTTIGFIKYKEDLYKRFSSKLESCLTKDPSNIEIKLCAAEVSEAVDLEIKKRKEYIINKINTKIVKLKKENDNLILPYMEGMPKNIEDTYKTWLDYRNSFCSTTTEIAMNGTGYSGFISSCKYEEGFKFMKFLDQMEFDWVETT